MACGNIFEEGGNTSPSEEHGPRLSSGQEAKWQQESPTKQELELVKRSSDLSCNG